MSAWQDQTEHEQMEQIRRTVQNKKMPQVSYTDDIMKRLEEMDMVSRKLTHKKAHGPKEWLSVRLLRQFWEDWCWEAVLCLRLWPKR